MDVILVCTYQMNKISIQFTELVTHSNAMLCRTLTRIQLSILLVSALILIQFLPLTNSQGNTVFSNVCNYLEYYCSLSRTSLETDLVAVNGPNSTGRWSNFLISNSRQNCFTPTNGVLFDGNMRIVIIITSYT